VLSDAGVEVRPTNMKSLGELVELTREERHKDLGKTIAEK
jgi:hypothetical protein